MYKNKFKTQNDIISNFNNRIKEYTLKIDTYKSDYDIQIAVNMRLENELLNIREEYDLLLDILQRDGELVNNDLEEILSEQDPKVLNNKLLKVVNQLKLEIFNYNLINAGKDKKKKKRI